VDKLDPGEIVYCDITYQYEKVFKNRKKSQIVTLRNVVFGREYDCSYPYLDYITYRRDINKINPKKILVFDVEVIDLQVHSRTGYKNKNKNYTLAKKNNESRNNITGAYE
jgi:hypothetical protein|tara:strand:- start:5008 stop:5337 length:330 start_codon:yes stop_codon:yes gene_type:complete